MIKQEKPPKDSEEEQEEIPRIFVGKEFRGIGTKMDLAWRGTTEWAEKIKSQTGKETPTFTENKDQETNSDVDEES